MNTVSKVLFTKGDKAALKTKIQSMSKKELLVICDFDHTISAFKVEPDGDLLCVSSHSVVEQAGLFGDEFQKESDKRFNTYYPLETDVHLSHEEREKVCNTWWSSSHDAIVQAGFHRSHILEAVEATTHRMRLRPGAGDFFSKFHGSIDRQLLVFSAGLADIIEGILNSNGLKNVPVFGNRMHFDVDDNLVKFDEWIIHSCNKSESVERVVSSLRPDIWLKEHAGEGKPFNCMVVGDSLGDASMADNLEPVVENVLKVGFLNAHHNKRFPSYREAFDILITQDGSMTVLNMIIQAIEDESRLDELLELFEFN